MDSCSLVEMHVVTVRPYLSENQPLVWLKEKAGQESRLLPIAIGEFEAASIQMCLEGDKPIRPIAYDLLVSILQSNTANVLQIVIHTVRQSIFYAKIVVEYNHVIQDIDARPSDAIALAIRMGSPIFASPEILNLVGIPLSESETDIEETMLKFSSLEPQIIDSTKTDPGNKRNIKMDVDEKLPTEIDNLRKKLANAIICEEYEEAARLRDQLGSIEKNGKL